MSAHALRTSEVWRAAGTARFLPLLDLAVLAVAALLAATLVAAPLLGIVVATTVWCLQRAVAALVEHRARALRRAQAGLGILAAGLLLRAWMVAFALLGAGVVDRQSGLTAAVLVALALQARLAVELPRRMKGLKGGDA